MLIVLPPMTIDSVSPLLVSAEAKVAPATSTPMLNRIAFTFGSSLQEDSATARSGERGSTRGAVAAALPASTMSPRRASTAAGKPSRHRAHTATAFLDPQRKHCLAPPG